MHPPCSSSSNNSAQPSSRRLVPRIDHDGDVDVVVGELSGPVRLLRNDGTPGGSWLIVELTGQSLGSRIDLHAGDLRLPPSRRTWRDRPSPI